VEVKNLRGGAAVIPAMIRQGKPFFAGGSA
jgi:hypothetical protein